MIILDVSLQPLYACAHIHVQTCLYIYTYACYTNTKMIKGKKILYVIRFSHNLEFDGC